MAGSVTLDHSGWVLLRAWNEHATPDVFDLYPYASTTPVYVQVGKTKVRSKEDADYFLAWIAKAKDSAAANPTTTAGREEGRDGTHRNGPAHLRTAQRGSREVAPDPRGQGAGQRIDRCAGPPFACLRVTCARR